MPGKFTEKSGISFVSAVAEASFRLRRISLPPHRRQQDRGLPQGPEGRPRRSGAGPLSAPEPMPCLAERCPSPSSCQHQGVCLARRDDSARSYSEAIAACRERNIIPDAWRAR